MIRRHVSSEASDREHAHPDPSHQTVRIVRAQPARTGDEVCAILDQWSHQGGHLRIVVLAVGIGGHDVARSAVRSQPVAETQSRALSAVAGCDTGVDAVPARNLCGLVRCSVDHNEDINIHVAAVFWDVGQHGSDTGGLVVRRDHHHQFGEAELLISPVEFCECEGVHLVGVVGEACHAVAPGTSSRKYRQVLASPSASSTSGR